MSLKGLTEGLQEKSIKERVDPKLGPGAGC